MDSSAGADQIDAVHLAARSAGLESTVFEGAPLQILLTGTPISDILPVLENMTCVAAIRTPSAGGIPITSNLRIKGIRPLISPAILMEQLPLTQERALAGSAIPSGSNQNSGG